MSITEGDLEELRDGAVGAILRQTTHCRPIPSDKATTVMAPNNGLMPATTGGKSAVADCGLLSRHRPHWSVKQPLNESTEAGAIQFAVTTLSRLGYVIQYNLGSGVHIKKT